MVRVILVCLFFSFSVFEGFFLFLGFVLKRTDNFFRFFQNSQM